MILGIVQTIWKVFFDLISSILTIDIIFYIGVGFLLLMSLFFFIRARTSYEYKLDRTADKLNDWLFTHQTINDQNLVEFNNIMKSRKSPKILRKYWQQYMLYRDKAPSEYMSAYNCIDKPLKTSSYNTSLKNYSMLYKITALITFFFSMFCFAGRAADAGSLLSFITQSLVSSIIILFIGVVLTLALRAMQNSNIATLYQRFNVFNRYIDKACETIPKYVDFEILFTKQEIRDSIPILSEYLEKRARQEQEELEEAQKNAVSHEEYDFSESGVDGSLVLERAMKESETYLNAKGRLEAEIKQFETEISSFNKNYENTSKDYQRKLQTSKENLERLRIQQEESTNRIEVNYIRKQQQDEIKKQEQLEKEQDSTTNTYNQEINRITEEIAKRKEEIAKKKLAVQAAMLSEYQTLSTKLHKAISQTVEKDKQDSIQEANNEKDKYAQAITYLKSEVDNRDSLIKAKDQTIAELATKLQSYLGEQYAQQNSNNTPTNETETNQPQQEEIPQEQPTQEISGHYGNNGYYWFDNGTYYDNNNLYHDLEGNVFDSDGNFIKSGEVVEKEEQFLQTEQVEQTEIAENQQTETSQENAESLEQESDSTNNSEQQAENNNSTEQENNSKEPENAQNQQTETIETTQQQDNNTEEIVDGKQDLSGNFTYSDGTYYDVNNLYHSDNGKVYNTEGVQVMEPETEQKPKRKVGRPKKVVPEGTEPKQKRKVGRPKKVKTEQEEQQPKRKVGRPKKVNSETENGEQKPKRKVGRPKKVVAEGTEPKPKRKVGRPKKVQAEQQETEQQPKRKVGRPRKTQSQETEQEQKRDAEKIQSAEQTPKCKAGRPKKVQTEQQETEQKPKRKVGRPKKVVTEEEQKPKRKVGRPKKSEQNESAKLLQQLGQSLLNITSQTDNNEE